MMVPLWLWVIFVFVMGCCIGSFLNVVIWRLPRGGSIMRPSTSYCPQCGKSIGWYDNIPIVSWLMLRAKCRHCRKPISARYPLVEALTGLVYVGLLLIYAVPSVRPDLGDWPGNWPGYLAALVLVSGLLAGSMIDLEHFFIPLPVVWIGGLVAVILSAARPGPWLPMGTNATAALGVGGAAGLIVSILLLWLGVLPMSFPEQAGAQADKPAPPPAPPAPRKKNRKGRKVQPPAPPKDVGVTVGARREVCKEILFLLPVIAGAIGWYWLTQPGRPLAGHWAGWCSSAHLLGLGGSLFGLLVGGGVIWAVRIIGTLLAGREAMGLGDVHLLAAAGALLGWGGATLAFFISPFFGLAVGIVQWIRQGRRELPFGPYLTLGVLVVLVFYDRLADWLGPPLRLVFFGEL